LNLVQQLRSIRNALAVVAERQSNAQAIGRPAMTSGDLLALGSALSGSSMISIINESGRIVTSSREQFIGHDASQREFFRTAKAGGDPRLLYVSRPFVNGLGELTINLTHVIQDKHGHFRGVASVALDQHSVSALLQSVRSTPDSTVAIIHGDAILFMCEPEGISAPQPGSMRAADSTFRQHLESGDIESVTVSLDDAESSPRLIAQRTVQPTELRMDKPLVVSVSRDLDSVLDHWRKEIAVELVPVLAFGLLGIFGLTYSQHQRRRLIDTLAERDSTGKALQDHAYDYYMLLDSINDAIFISQDTKYVYANPAACSMLGYSYESLLNLTITDLVSEQDLPRLSEHLLALKAGAREHTEWRLKHANGDWIWVKLATQVMSDGRYLAIARDISARKKYSALLLETQTDLEQKLKQRTLELEAALDAANLANKTHDPVAEEPSAVQDAQQGLDGLAATADVDTEAGLARFAGSIDRYEHWLRQFASEGPATLDKIKHDLTTHQSAQALSALHAFKGRVGMLGMTALHAKLAQVEAQIRLNEAATAELAQVAEDVAVMGETIVNALGNSPGNAP
jgi:PAS domain S-box-containing protein